MPKFIIRFPSGGETSFLAEDDDIFVGRIPSINDICINDPTVSRQHAHIKRREEGYTVYDLKSLNGLFVNGKKVSKSLLKDGDEIQLGDIRVEVSFRSDSQEEVLRSIEQSENTHAEYKDDPAADPPPKEVTQPRLKKPGKKNP
jgi:pSer/pThr/pTyr-binding forkhead associated (FHA) protein